MLFCDRQKLAIESISRFRSIVASIILAVLGMMIWAGVQGAAAQVPGSGSVLVDEQAMEPRTDASAEGAQAVTAAPGDMGNVFDRGLPLALVLVFFIGLALNLTPCVYPMLAITVSIFGGQDQQHPRRAFGKALVYVFGIATMYSILGVAAALTGGLFGGLLQSRAVLVGISVLFVALALSMFGLYEIQVPAALTAKLGGAGNTGLAGTFISGLLVGIFAAPCVGPPIIGLLLLVGQRGDPLFGFLIFFVLSLGLGLPYLALGTFSGLLQKLPRSGEWMVWVRKLLGLVLIGIAGFYLSLAFRPSLVFVLIPLILVLGGIYLGFFERSRSAGRMFPVVKRVVGVAALLAGVLLFMHGRKPSLDWTPYDSGALADADRTTVIYFSADWCIPCLELDRRTFTVDQVMRELNRFERFKVDLTRFDSPESQELRERYEILGVPTMVFLNAAGDPIPGTRLIGFVPPDDMVQHLRDVRAKAGRPVSASDFFAVPEDGLPSSVRLVTDTEWIQPGTPFRAGVLFEMQESWHVYWLNPGDSGAEPQIDWHWPEGFEADQVQWPHPQRFDDPPFATFGHEDEFLLALTVHPPSTLEPGTTVTLSADVDWLVCKAICIAQDGRVTLTLEVRDEPPVADHRWQQIFEWTDARVPVDAPGWHFTAVSADGNTIMLTMRPPDGLPLGLLQQTEFFPAQIGFLQSGPYRWQRDGETLRMSLTREGPMPDEKRLRAVLVLPESAVETHDLPRALIVDTDIVTQ